MSSYDAHALVEGGLPAGHDERHRDHGPWEILNRDLDDDEGYAFATIVARIRVSQCEDQGMSEDVAVKEKPCSGLLRVLALTNIHHSVPCCQYTMLQAKDED